MRASRGIAVALAAAIGIPCAAAGALGQESGSFSAIATYVRDFTSIEHADGAYFGGKLEGSTTILASSGDPFTAGGHSLSTCVVFGKRSAAGLDLQTACNSTNASGDTLYLVAERRGGRRERWRRRTGPAGACGRHRSLCRAEGKLRLRDQLSRE